MVVIIQAGHSYIRFSEPLRVAPNLVLWSKKVIWLNFVSQNTSLPITKFLKSNSSKNNFFEKIFLRRFQICVKHGHQKIPSRCN